MNARVLHEMYEHKRRQVHKCITQQFILLCFEIYPFSNTLVSHVSALILLVLWTQYRNINITTDAMAPHVARLPVTIALAT